MSSKTKSRKHCHWVEELFPPTYSYTLKGILNEPVPSLSTALSNENNIETQYGKSEHLSSDAPSKMSLFDKLAKQIRPGDVESIKNVYERVWFMVQLEHEQKINQGSLCEDSSKQVNYVTKKGVEVKDAGTSTLDEDVDSHNIWSSEEMSVLRKVLQATKQQNLKLLGSLEAAKEEVLRLGNKLYELECINNTKSTHLHEAKKANHRFKILTQNLKCMLDKSTSKMAVLEEEILKMKKERKSLVDSKSELQIALDKERIDRKRIETDLANKHQEMLRELILREENLEAMHQQDVQFLQNDIKDIKKQLAQEKKEHVRTQKGLNQLRTHFSSLPYAGESEQSSIVKQDELNLWTY